MADQSSDLSRFLAEESGRGERLDQGEFTVDVAQARQKLSEFSLAEPGLWVVKIVQAAVASRATSVAFTFSRKQVTIRFPDHHGWDAAVISKVLLQGQDPPDDAYFHLRTGLMAACSGPQESVAWACRAQSYVLQGDELQQGSSKETSDLVVLVKRSRSQKGARVMLAPIRYLFRQTAHEYKALVDRCGHSPIPISIDGIELPRAYLRPVAYLPRVPGFNGEASEGWKLALAVKPSAHLQGRSPLAYPLSTAPESGGETFTTHHWPALDQPASAVVCLYECQQRMSRVNFLLDGVLVEQRTPFESEKCSAEMEKLRCLLEDGPVGFVFELYLNTERERLDLSHFATREEDFERLVLSIIPVLRELFEEAKDACEGPWEFSQPSLVHHFETTPLANASILDLGTAFYLSGLVPHYYLTVGVTRLGARIGKSLKPHYDRRKRDLLKPRLEEILSTL